jgi:hypothetical protein
LEATTHVVGHLLRELDLVLRAVLRPIVPVDRWPPRDTRDANRKQIDAICDALGVGADDPFRELWREYARPLHEWAHLLARRAAPSGRRVPRSLGTGTDAQAGASVERPRVRQGPAGSATDGSRRLAGILGTELASVLDGEIASHVQPVA